MTTTQAQRLVDEIVTSSSESQEDIRHIASQYDTKDLPLPNNLQTDALSIVQSAILRSADDTLITKGELSFEDTWDAAEIVAHHIETLVLKPKQLTPTPKEHTMNANAVKPKLEDIWETMASIEGHDNDSGATSYIDKDQAVDQDTDKAWFDSYRMTLADGEEYWYDASEMEGYARTW
jgi:hypothetical protein